MALGIQGQQEDVCPLEAGRKRSKWPKGETSPGPEITFTHHVYFPHLHGTGKHKQVNCICVGPKWKTLVRDKLLNLSESLQNEAELKKFRVLCKR